VDIMQKFFEVTLNQLAQFTGSQGGIEHGIVQYGLAAIFWLLLLLIARSRQKERGRPYEKLLLIGFSLCLSRELFMILIATLPAYGVFSVDSLHVFFPPLEHAIFDIAVVVISSAYIKYLLKDKRNAFKYLKFGILLVFLAYVITAIWWGKFISINPGSKFGQTWCDWLFRINASILIMVPLVLFLKRTRGWTRNAISLALSFFLLNQFLKIPDMALGEVYESIFTPIRNSFYIFGIIIFGYVYIRELNEERIEAGNRLQRAHDLLEHKVAERTAELENKIAEITVLSGLLPICSSCKKIRNDDGYWTQIESYITANSEAQFSHGICEECAVKLYGEDGFYSKD